MTKFGGVKISLQRVADIPASDTCAGCGRSHAECADWWDAELKIAGHQADTGAKSEYAANVRKIRLARLEGRDPYCLNATLAALGYASHWTPAMPAGSFIPIPKHLAVSVTLPPRGKSDGTEANRNQRDGGSNGTTRRSGRRGKSKSVRRKR